MPPFLHRLKERHLVQWSLAYLGGAWLLLSVLDVLADPWGIPAGILRSVTLILGLGLLATWVLAWYHGEKGRQRVSGPELLLLAGIAVCAALLVRLTAGGGAEAEPVAQATAPRGGNAVAVLPFLDLSPAGDQQHFSDGIAVEIISALRRHGGVRVTGQSSSFALRGRPAVEVGAVLGVAAVLEGSVRMEGDSMRITASLTSAVDGFEIWSQDFNRPAANILQTQAEIAGAVVAGVTGEPAQAARSVGTIDPEAYESYVRGRLAWDRRGEADIRRAQSYFQQAIELAPDFAPARSGLADTYTVMAFYNYLPPEEAFPEAARQAEAALALDPDLPEALATAAYVTLYWDWDWEAAEAGFRRAIEEAEDYATAHQWLGNVLVVTGRTAEGTRAVQRALELDPGSLIARVTIAWTRSYDREFKAGLAELEELIRFDSRYPLSHWLKGWMLQQLGDFPGAVSALETSVALSDSLEITVAALAGAYAHAGREGEARALLARLQDPERTRNPPLYEIAKVHLALGETEAALDWLERAHDARALQLVFIGVDPEVDPLRDHPRFQSLLRRMDLG